MATIKNFEDIESWKKAPELAGFIYSLTRKGKFAVDYALKNQIQDAAGSTMHNIAEGFESGYDSEFVRFLKIARRSAGEVQSELYLLHLMRNILIKRSWTRHINSLWKLRSSSMV